MEKGEDEGRAAVVEGWLVMGNNQGCQADPALLSPFEPHVWVGREQQASRRQKGSISPRTRGRDGEVGSVIWDEGGTPREGDAWVAKVSLKPTNGAGRRLHTCARS